MEKYNHFEYGEILARKHKLINHTDTRCQYYRATEQNDIQELNSQITSAKGVILIAIDGAESSFNYRDSDSLMEQPQYMFGVAEQTISGSPESIYQAQRNCKKIAMQLIAAMMQNSSRSNFGLNYLDPSSFRIKGFGPIGDLFYGVILMFNLDQGINYQLDTNVWED